jgi:hypothetical protein
MTWTFHVLATAQRRLFSRILQVLESQMVSIHSFEGQIGEEDAYVSFTFFSEQDRADRVKALLYRLEGIRSVSVSNQ